MSGLSNRVKREKRNKPCVYKILFPDGNFYIGVTTKKLRYRLSKHLTREGDREKTVSSYIEENDIKKEDIKIVVVKEFDCVSDAYICEAAHIIKNFKNTNMINKCIRLYRSDIGIQHETTV